MIVMTQNIKNFDKFKMMMNKCIMKNNNINKIINNLIIPPNFD